MGYRFRNYSKYKARKTQKDGRVFDSKKEARRFSELRLLEACGEIKELQTQVKFVLIPPQREPDTLGPRGGKRRGRTIERECYYIADFCYIDVKTGQRVVEDVKGYKDGGAYTVFSIKRKLMLERYGIRIKEV